MPATAEPQLLWVQQKRQPRPSRQQAALFFYRGMEREGKTPLPGRAAHPLARCPLSLYARCAAVRWEDFEFGPEDLIFPFPSRATRRASTTKEGIEKVHTSGSLRGFLGLPLRHYIPEVGGPQGLGVDFSPSCLCPCSVKQPFPRFWHLRAIVLV